MEVDSGLDLDLVLEFLRLLGDRMGMKRKIFR